MSSVTAGFSNWASGDRASINGRSGNFTKAQFSAVAGGDGNQAEGATSTIAGGINQIVQTEGTGYTAVGNERFAPN